MEYMVSGSRNSSTFMTNSRNEQMPTKIPNIRVDNQRKNHIDQEGPKQMNRPKQLQTHKLSTDDLENINSTCKERDFLFANKPRIVPRGKQWMPQRIQRHNRVTFHR